MNDQGRSESDLTDSRSSERPVGCFSDRGFFYRGVLVSALMHGMAFGVLYVVLDPDLRVRSNSDSPFLVVHQVNVDDAPLELPEEIIEPEWTPEVSELNEEPELVEQPFVPPDLPLDPLPPEPLDWNPPTDIITRVLAFKHPPELQPPEPETEQVVPDPPAPPRVLEGDEIPEAIADPLPSYPRQARRMGWQGTVCLRISVNAAGLVTEVQVEESSGHQILDDAALKAFRRWVFQARRSGEPALRLVRKRFTFRIQ